MMRKPINPNKPNFKEEMESFHREIITDNSKRQMFKTRTFLEFSGRDKQKIQGILQQIGIMDGWEVRSSDYVYYPERLEQLVRKLRTYGCKPSPSFYFSYPDEPKVWQMISTLKPKQKMPAKSNSLDELKQRMKTYGPALYSNDEYHMEYLIWTNSIVYLDLEKGLSSDKYPHAHGRGHFWKDQETLLGEQKIGNFEFVCLATGSGEELPTVYILYLDVDGDIRGYVPTEGNAFNVKDDDVNEVKEAYDWDKIKQDIVTNIPVI